jgi:hypothetical protein
VAHVVPTQLALAQSASARHPCPSGQAGQLVPPQSTPVSSPFLAPSGQAGTWQAFAVHTPSTQSDPALHACPEAQPLQLPPQSTSLSVPFFCPSVHPGARQRSKEQTPLSQSLPAKQAPPVVQGGQVGPPQSTSVSVPF